MSDLYRVTIYLTRDMLDKYDIPVRGSKRVTIVNEYIVRAADKAEALAMATSKTMERWSGFAPHIRSDVDPSISLCPDGIAVVS